MEEEKGGMGKNYERCMDEGPAATVERLKYLLEEWRKPPPPSTPPPACAVARAVAARG